MLKSQRKLSEHSRSHTFFCLDIPLLAAAGIMSDDETATASLANYICHSYVLYPSTQNSLRGLCIHSELGSSPTDSPSQTATTMTVDPAEDTITKQLNELAIQFKNGIKVKHSLIDPIRSHRDCHKDRFSSFRIYRMCIVGQRGRNLSVPLSFDRPFQCRISPYFRINC